MKTADPLPSAIADEAAHWVVRLASGAMTHSEQQALALWQQQSPIHRAALAREQQFWQSLDALRPAFAEAASLYHRDVTPTPLPARNPLVPSAARVARLPARGAIAAAALLFALFLGVLWPAAGDYRTGAGELRTVTLADGSSIMLNTRTRVAVNYSEQKREITLLEGEAWFDVAPNPERPFRVYAGGGYTEAVGTSFNVHSRGDAVAVAVTSGQVKVKSGAASRQFAPVFASKGDALRYSKGGAPVAAAESLAHALAWQQGWVEVDELPLREAVAELNRYLPGKVVLANSALADVQVSGSFRQTQLSDALDALAATQQLKVLRLTPYLHIIY